MDASFWDGVATRYVGRPISDTASYERTLAMTEAHLRADMIGVELGCGSGMTARRLAPRMQALTAVDFSEGMIGHARRLHAQESGPDNLDYRVATLEDLAGQTVDVVLAFNLIHLLPDRDAALAQIHALLRPGGLFISKTGCVGGAWQLLRAVIGPMQRLGKAPRNLRYFTPAQLERSVQGAGFEILETTTAPKRPPARFIVARRR